MITDMVGYSREMQRSEEGTLLKLLRHNELVRVQLARHGGREIKTMGDAFLVTFPGAVEAVRAALEIQREIESYNRLHQAEAERIVIRIGIHTGEVLTLDGDVLGNGVNIAARLEPLAEPGGICISADTYARVRDALDVPVTSLGRRELKNIADAPELFRLRPSSPS
jgi:adenylate cyclase